MKFTPICAISIYQQVKKPLPNCRAKSSLWHALTRWMETGAACVHTLQQHIQEMCCAREQILTDLSAAFSWIMKGFFRFKKPNKAFKWMVKEVFQSFIQSPFLSKHLWNFLMIIHLLPLHHSRYWLHSPAALALNNNMVGVTPSVKPSENQPVVTWFFGVVPKRCQFFFGQEGGR